MGDIRKFSGRGMDQALTEFISRRILTELAVGHGDRLVDIGCGDGTLLRFALQAGVSEVIGLSGSERETECLRQESFNVSQAYTDSLPLPDQCASAVVCNSVLHIVPGDKIPPSLREIARIAQPQARIWIGELPRFREAASIRSFASFPAMLWWLLRKRGLRSFFGMGRRLLIGEQKEPVLRTAQAFWSEPEHFIQMASDAGMRIERHFPHESLDSNQQPCVSTTRHDYLFKKE